VLAGLLTANPDPPGTGRAVTRVTWLSVLFVAVSTDYAPANPNPNAFGPHNFAHYTAIVILLAGRGAVAAPAPCASDDVAAVPRHRWRTAGAGRFRHKRASTEQIIGALHDV
jgi:hypothetical protein